MRRCRTCHQPKPLDNYRTPNARKCDDCIAGAGTKACRKCGLPKPRGEFLRGGSNCEACRKIITVRLREPPPRACHRCHVVKPVSEFPEGPQLPETRRARTQRGPRLKRRWSSVCQACWDLEAEQKAARPKRGKWRNTRVRDDGKTVRVCRSCGVEKLLNARNFYRDRKNRYKDGSRVYDHRCITCDRAASDEYKAHARATNLAEVRRKSAETSARWRRNNPEGARAARRRARERVKADPELKARANEDKRIAYRLRQERKGLAVGGPRVVPGHWKYHGRGPVFENHPERRVPHPETGVPVVPSWCPGYVSAGGVRRAVVNAESSRLPARSGWLPVGPLLAKMVEIGRNGRGPDIRVIQVDPFAPAVNGTRRGEADDWRGPLCALAEVHPRRFYAWEVGEAKLVTPKVADKVLTRLGLMWWEVWDPADWPEEAHPYEAESIRRLASAG